MPRPKKGSPEAKAWAAAMKAKREAKKTVQVSESAPEALLSNEEVTKLLKRVEELEKQQFFSAPRQIAEAVKAITKYSVDAKDYPDPRERLYDEPRLNVQYNFRRVFTLEWNIGRVQYQKDGVNYTEPKFRLELWRWVDDPETGELTNKKYRVHKATFFEDPDAAIQIANDKGHELDPHLEKDFLDEMRYLRMRDWLFEIFYPAPVKKSESSREEIIGNRLVPVVEVSSHEAQNIFNKI